MSPSFPEVLVPALPSSVMQPLWDQFRELLPDRVDTHPLGCRRPRIPDRVVFDKLVQVLVYGVGYARIADGMCSATTIRERRDEWIEAGIFDRLEHIALEAYDRLVGLDLGDLTVDGCIVKASCGGEAAGRSPVDRGKQGTKRSLLVEATGIGDRLRRRRRAPQRLPAAAAHPGHAGSLRSGHGHRPCPITSPCIWTPA